MADPRIANASWFRAEGAVLPWAAMFDDRIRQADQMGRVDPELLRRLREAVGRRPQELHLRWACSGTLGVPRGPFTVWARPPRDAPRPVDVRQVPSSTGSELRLGFVASYVEVECAVQNPAAAVAVLATRWGGSLRETVAAAAVRAPGGGRVTLRVRCAGATRAVIVNGGGPFVVRAQRLQETVDDGAWRPIEVVGLPVNLPWPGTAYRDEPQGLVTALGAPAAAAMARLERGGPPLGWFLLTEAGRAAPAWRAPDYPKLLEELRADVLPRVERLYRPGLAEFDQAALVDSPPVDPPTAGGRVSSLAATASLPPFALLTLPAAADPFVALAAGFGTAYPVGQVIGAIANRQRPDFLVTADYDETPLRRGKATVAAYVPSPGAHGSLASPGRLTAERAGLVAPEARDRPWRETVRVSWDRGPASAALGRASGAALARYAAAAGAAAECLLPVRAAGDFRPLLTVPDGPEGAAGFDRSAVVDAAAVIPLGSGGRQVGYAAAVEDVFGVWSRWEDVPHLGPEPAAPVPRVLALALTAAYAGSPTCPATLEVEVAVDWADRTPTHVELAAVFFRMADARTPPPAGVGPTAPAPAGGFRRDVVLPFAGQQLTAPAGVAVEHLDAAGEQLVTPGPLQGEQGRRYRVRVPVPALDFGVIGRWGVQLWTRARLAVFPGTPTGWAPDPARPALGSAASPVPVAPLPPPQPPGVPVGSTPDAEGCSHARVRWSLPGGADVEKVVLWEVAETALRQAAAVAARAPEGTLPGVRLQQLRDLYNALPAARRRSAFRRLRELPGAERAADVALPRGSTDIHLFAVTTVTRAGVESPWPGGAQPHEHLQAVAAPRLRRPAAPRVRAVVAADGTVSITLAVPSRVPVREFRLYRTRSPDAARSYESMGPAFAVVPAGAPGGVDPATGERTYPGAWSGAFVASWDEWFVRAVAVPEDLVPVEAVRGVPGPASEAVSLAVVPAGPPDLAPLVAEVWGAANDGVLVLTSTSAPPRAVPLGSHKVSAVVTTAAGGARAAAPVALELVPAGATAAAGPPPAGTGLAPLFVRGARAAGRTPLALWCTRPAPGEPAEVVVRLADPLGRVAEQRLTVPPWTPPPSATLELIEVIRIAGRGAVVRLRSDAPLAPPPFVLEVLVQSTARPPFPPLPFPRPTAVAFPLPGIPRRPPPFPSAEPLQMVRTTDAAPHEYQLLVRVAAPYRVTVTLVSPEGARRSVRADVR